jgi:hypothetical protein
MESLIAAILFDVKIHSRDYPRSVISLVIASLTQFAARGI